jgi:adenosylcobinamide kinase / adenosylcobinamide-phosphate guanylyltransferase
VRVLVLGGNRSGKSEFAEALFAHVVSVEYLATADERPDDPEWTRRIAEHQARRSAQWTTSETLDVAGALRRDGPALLVESVTLWLARALDGDVEHEVDELCTAWDASSRFAVLVSDEVGLGVVPATPEGRRFRDALGRLNQRLAASADEVHLVVAGIPLRLK